jgi:FtsP/CotA-like multicopper oxidase with cupredoxin domain
MTREAAPAGTVTYTFTAQEPGTYMYQSGTSVEKQIEMGLVGAIIVRPDNFNPLEPTAYGTAATAYDREFLFFLTDMDRSAHEGLDGGYEVDPASYAATLWFINGRNGPDTMHVDNAPWLVNQPYGSLVEVEPSDRVLMRLVGAGRDLHPFHHHGNNAWVIAQDGRVLESSPGAEAGYPDFEERPCDTFANPGCDNWMPENTTLPDESVSNYTITVVPGNTYDAIFTWTGRDLNWDIYGNQTGHTPGNCGALMPSEDPNSHCKDLQVKIPEQQALTFGGLWSGSIFMGTVATLPPGQGGLNPRGGFAFMWHSHTERELTNDDVFPGGMMTMLIVEEPGSLPAPVNIAP